MKSSAARGSGAALLCLTLLVLGVLAWMLCHPYQGLFHDANLYALQALARLYPQSLSRDVFLSHGSQDRFTVFSPLFAQTIAILGLDRAAATLTLLSQLALVTAAYSLARVCLSRVAAAAAIVLLLALPGDYGPERIFTVLEPFLTPRMLAEALTLAMLAAALRRRPLLAAVLAVAAMAMHPVMALAGVAAICVARLTQWTSWRALAAALGLLLVAGLGALVLGGLFDGSWLAVVKERSPYLFLGYWTFEDWTRAGVMAAELIIAALALPAPLARLSCVVLVTLIVGWLVTLLGADLGHLVLPTQVQAWRWQWLGCAASALVLPSLLNALWTTGDRGRGVALLIVASWIFRDGSYALVAAGAAIGLHLLPSLDARRDRLLLAGAAALLFLAALWRLASNLEFTDVHYMDAALPLALRRAMSFAKDGTAIVLLLGCALLCAARRQLIPQSAILMLVLAASAAVLPFAWQAWTARSFPESLSARFAPWRDLIPPQSEVLWNESPLGAWALLQRPHYISGLQSSGVVFSRAAALDLKQRAEALASAISPSSFLSWTNVGAALSAPPETLQAVCRLGVVPYVVTSADLGIEPVAQDRFVPHGLKLYRCRG